jgi:hypothetical protein
MHALAARLPNCPLTVASAALLSFFSSAGAARTQGQTARSDHQ